MKFRKIILIKIFIPSLMYISSIPLYAADLCFCPEKPIGSECKGQCVGNPGGVVVVLPNKPDQPGTNPFESNALWSMQSLEKFRNNNEKYRILLESSRIDAEAKREQTGEYPPSLYYKKNMSDYFKGIDHYKANMYQYKNLQRSIK